jgi:isopentenyldiphosphate isomerase
MTSEEWVDRIDEEDRVVGRVTRAQMRAQNLLHRSVAVMCLNPAGCIYVQRRSETKDVFPGLYDMFVGGVVGAGESYHEAALREIAEELAIAGPRPELLFKHRYEGPRSRSHTAVYRVVWDGPICHQASEVAWGGYCTTEEIAANPCGWSFVPDGREIFERYLAARSDRPRPT